MQFEAVRRRNGAALAGLGLLFVAASALAGEIGGPEMIDTAPPKEKPVEKPAVKPPIELERPVEKPLEPEPPEPPEPVPPRERGPRAPLGITVRAGYLLPNSAQDTYGGAFAFGASYTLAPQESRVSYEFGVDAAWSDRDDGAYSTTLTFLRAAALYRLLRTDGTLYLLGGANLGLESTDGTQPSTNSAGAVDLGVGGKFASVDTRLAYSIYLGSENSAGSLALSVGYSF